MPNMKRFTGLLNRTKSNGQYDFSSAPTDSPEATASRSIRLFCESGSTSNRDEEVLHLPVIVEAAESSPQAAAACAQQIRKFLTKEFSQKPHVQYNAIMLVRILCDHPGPPFTAAFDKTFVSTVKDCLRQCKDGSVQQMLRETLDHLEAEKAYDESLQGLLTMWKKEKGPQAGLSQSSGGRRPPMPHQTWPPAGGMSGASQRPPVHHSGSSRAQTRHQLPPPFELASRVEEARNTAKILLQFLQSTPQEEVLGNELIQEFSERCLGAQRSMQSYINCDSPPPDDDTMLTLIETNEQLSLASSRHQRALLGARRALGVGSSTVPGRRANESMNDGTGAFTSPPAPGQRESVMFAQSQPPQLNGFGSNGFGSGAFGSAGGFARDSSGKVDTYNAPPGPPPSMLNRLDSREGQQVRLSRSPVEEPPSNPFEDPIEHSANPAPLAYDSSTPRQRSPVHSGNNYTIDAGPTYGSTDHSLQRRDTVALENAYSGATSSAISAPSPDLYNDSPTFSRNDYQQQRAVSPQSPPRPPLGPWHNSGTTPSYFGRQASAVNGPTMYGAQSDGQVNEIDTHSEVGRHEHGGVSPELNRAQPRTPTSPGNDSMYSVSPVEGRRVDVAGTGGFRATGVGH